MIDQEILTQFEALVEDSLDQTLEIQFANNAKNRIESELQLQILKKLDTSKASLVGGTYLTAYELPSDIFEPLRNIYVGSTPRKGIRIEEREKYKDDPSYFYIDWANNQYFLCGTVVLAEVITFPYLYATPDITTGTLDGTTLVWPTRFHSLLAFEMAWMFYAVDQGEKLKDWSPTWLQAYQNLRGSMVDWDHRLKLNAIAFQTPYGEESTVSTENRINF